MRGRRGRAKSDVTTVACQPGHDAPGTNKKMHGEEDGGGEDDKNDDRVAASDVSSGGLNCEGGDDKGISFTSRNVAPSPIVVPGIFMISSGK